MADPTSTPSLAESLDAAIANFFASHNPLTYLLLGFITFILVYPLITGKDPDTHPFLLARQSSAAPIRNPKESPLYRALDVPHGYPLRNALGVKDIGAPKWTSGRRGDLRDVLARAVTGPINADATAFDGSKVGKVWTLSGKNTATATEMKELMRMVNALGSFAKSSVAADGRVAVCLSNSVELLAGIVAAAFYDYQVTLIPQGLPQDVTDHLLKQTNVNVLIAEAGALDLNTALPNCKSLKQVILVAKPDSKHMDWASTPMPKGVSVTTWDDLLSSSSATTEVPKIEKDADKPKPIGTFHLNAAGEMELTEFTSDNLISGTAALLTSLPRTQPLSPTDILLPTTPLTNPYTLTWTLAALFSNASLALNSVAGPTVDLFAATTTSFQPTILVTSPGTLQRFLANYPRKGLGVGGLAKFWQRRSLRSGVMPTSKPVASASGVKGELAVLSKLRAVFVGHDGISGGKQALSSKDLDELRTELGVKIGYALTSGKVAGAVSQTNIHDYRDKGEGVVCVGPPAGSVEVKLVGEDDGVVGRGKGGVGMIVVNGPAVANEQGEVQLDVKAKIDFDHTLVLL